MKQQTLVKKCLPQNPDIEVLVPNYKEPILPVNHGGFGWYGLQAYHVDGSGRLMCHECGEFRDSLSNHIHKHGLKPKEYKVKYNLLMKSKLISDSYHIKLSSIALTPAHQKRFNEIARTDKTKENNLKSDKLYERRQVLESLNRRDTCPNQLLRQLLELAEIYGSNIDIRQVRSYNIGFDKLLARRFGSFNKAKQILQLMINNHGNPNLKQAILEDMCLFYSKHNRWPVKKDYINGLMLTSNGTVCKYGGLKALRLEAMKLKEEQDTRTQFIKQIPYIAAKIEIEYAGRSRR